jgi:MtfA peptidase
LLRQLRNGYQRWRIARQPIPDRLWSTALRSTTYVGKLTTVQRARLRELATLFLLDKRFTSAHDLRITDAMRVRVAIKACVPILELGLECYSHFKGIVLYPGDFRVHEQHVDEAGVLHEEIRELCGQSLAQGPMVLSWDTLAAERAADGQDLVIHECAHKLDVLNGDADGFPPLRSDMSAPVWTRAFRTAYDRLCSDVDAGRRTRLDPYATADAAEFFAVTSETFFTRPDIVHEDFADIYAQLAAFYRQDPYSLLKP